MQTQKETPKDVDAYIADFPPEAQSMLQQVRGVIRAALPAAEEAISYGIPTFKMNGRYVIYFSGYKNHVSVYPAPIGVEEFIEELAPYQSGKGTARFALNKPLPVDLITRIAAYNLKENQARVKAKGKKSVRS